MAVYNPPDSRFEGTYNPSYFIGKEDEKAIEQTGTILTGDFIRRDGSSIMTGGLMTPAITLFNDGRIVFKDDTIQNTAFTDIQNTLLTSNNQKITNISFDDTTDITNISNSLKVSKIIFSGDNNSEQSISFNLSNRNDINDSKLKLTNTAYDQSLNKTTINNNCHINNLTTGNFNTSFLSNINTDVHTELLKIKQITNVGQITTINGQTSTNIVNLFGDGITGRQLKFYNGSTPSVQISAFTETHKTALESYILGSNTNTRNISYDEVALSTNIIGDLKVDNIILNNETQVNAFTPSYKTKLDLLNINSNRILVNKIIFDGDGDDTVYQTTAYTNIDQSSVFTTKNKTSQITYNSNTQLTTIANNTYINNLSCGNAQLSDIATNKASLVSQGSVIFTHGLDIGLNKTSIDIHAGLINTLIQKTAPISTSHALVVDGNNLSIPNINVNTITMNNAVQNYPYTDAERNLVNAPMADSSKTSLNFYSTNIGLSASGNSFISGSITTNLLNLPTGLHTINGSLSVLNPNSVQLMKYRLRVSGSSSPYIGVNFDTGYDNYGDFLVPISWTFKILTQTMLMIDISCNYKPNSNLTSSFDYQVLTFN